MKLRLRWKIMFFTVLPLVTLAFATLWIVNRSISRQVQQGIHDDLRRASAVLENLLATRSQSLVLAAQMTVQDPKFFSVLTIPSSHRDPELRATIAGVARDFNEFTHSDLFEVTDAAGNLLAAVGRDVTVASGRDVLVREALKGRPVATILTQPSAHYQVSVTPVHAGGRVVGTLLLGARIGGELADRLRLLTRSEVTFVSQGAVTGTTLENGEERGAVLSALSDLERSPRESQGGTVLQVHGGTHLYLTLVHALPQSEHSQRQFFVMQRALDAETLFLRETQTKLVGLGITAVLVALLAGFLIAERITSPVQRLVRGAEEMEHGNYDFPLAVRSRDEIGELASQFEVMRRRQREYVHSLQEIARVKSEFIGVASHELRTPISVIRGFHELMLDGKLGPISPQQRQALEAADRCSATLTRIAEDATRMAQIEGDHLVLERGEHVVAGLVDQAIAKARGYAVGRKVAIEREVDPQLESVRVDADTIVQALSNLVCNGIRFTPDGGRVMVRAFGEDSPPDGPCLVFTVTDNGIGIDAERQQNLFDRTFNVRDTLNHHSSSTLEFNSAGLGLGLPIARGIVEAHGGRISVNSAPGTGTTFTIRIPVASLAQMEAAA
jgi:signal transduction histidine kinase